MDKHTVRNKSFLGMYIDRIVVLTDDRKVYGVDALKINNGYEFLSIPEKPELEPDEISIAVVALFAFWHGYERLIGGLHDYYISGGMMNFQVHFVGDGSELNYYRRLTKQYRLDAHIHFYGIKDEIFLKKLYRRCAFGCCGLGAYKKNLYYSNELKSREYLAAGLPIITGCKLDIDGEKSLSEYVIPFSNNDKLIDFYRIEKMYKRYYGGKTIEDIHQLRCQIWDKARNVLSMNLAMKNVIDYVGSNN